MKINKVTEQKALQIINDIAENIDNHWSKADLMGTINWIQDKRCEEAQNNQFRLMDIAYLALKEK